MFYSVVINGTRIFFHPEVQRWTGSPVTRDELSMVLRELDRPLSSGPDFDTAGYTVVATARGLDKVPAQWIYANADNRLPRGGRVGRCFDSNGNEVGAVTLVLTARGNANHLVFGSGMSALTIDIPEDIVDFAGLTVFLKHRGLTWRLIHLLQRAVELPFQVPQAKLCAK